MAGQAPTFFGPVGYLGYVTLFGTPFRAMSCSLKAKQTINFPDVSDGTLDRTLYALGPVEVDGDVSVPVTVGDGSNNSIEGIYGIAFHRLANGDLASTGTINVFYGVDSGRSFNGCRVNTFELKATAGEKVDVTLGIMGAGFDTGSPAGGHPGPFGTGRILTWNEVEVLGIGDSCHAKGFTLNINNNCQRNFTFCKQMGLFASNISTGKRAIQGSLEYQGANPNFANETAWAGATDVESRRGSITIAISGTFNKTFEVVWEFQSIDLSTSLITSTANWYSIGNLGL